MRALVFACLCRSDNAQAFQQLRNLSVEATVPRLLLDEVRRYLAESFEQKPNVLDMFGGGGTIPFECASLGVNTFALDSNELSVFVQRTILTHSLAVPNGRLVQLVRTAGRRVLDSLAARTAAFFPLRGKVFGYLWSYSIECRNCGCRFLLAKRPWLSKKNGRRLALVTRNDNARQTVSIENVPEDYAATSVWTGRNGTIVCPACKTERKGFGLADTSDELIALAGLGETSGKTFLPAGEAAIPSRESLLRRRKSLFKNSHSTFRQVSLQSGRGSLTLLFTA